MQRVNQLGFLMRAHRHAFVAQDGTQGISLEELLRRMAEADPEYAERYSHSTASRWESGSTQPDPQRLKVFGKALQLTPNEVEGLLRLASIQGKDFSERRLSCPRCGGETQITTLPGRKQSNRRVYEVQRKRTCIRCGYTAQSSERWKHKTEQEMMEITENALEKIKSANRQIRNVLDSVGIE